MTYNYFIVATRFQRRVELEMQVCTEQWRVTWTPLQNNDEVNFNPFHEYLRSLFILQIAAILMAFWVVAYTLHPWRRKEGLSTEAASISPTDGTAASIRPILMVQRPASGLYWWYSGQHQAYTDGTAASIRPILMVQRPASALLMIQRPAWQLLI